MDLRELKFHAFWGFMIWVVFILSCFVNAVKCQGLTDADPVNNSAILPIATRFVYSSLSNLTANLSRDLKSRYGFCIKDPNADWDKAFNFSSNLDFVASCLQRTQGDLPRRLCTAAELKFYLDVFVLSGGNSLRPNRNCNMSAWVPGCEPGWACSVDQNEQVDLQNSHNIPARTYDCDICCEGFFCPHGLTCMIPCPLGAYCPLATLNTATGICEPYTYQLPAGQRNHTCGGANIWGHVSRTSEVFCSAGSYCPTTTEKSPCSSGHYCRMGSTSEKRCFRLTSCDPNTSNQNMHVYGAMLVAATSTLLLLVYNCSDQVISIRERRLAKTREAAARSAKEKARAQRKWKAAKEAARKHTSGFQAQLSRKFSLKKSSEQLEELQILDKKGSEQNFDLYPSSHMSDSCEPSPSSMLPHGEHVEPGNGIQMMHEIEEETESKEGFGHKNAARKAKISTHSQIFRYAYGKLEKERAELQDRKSSTFSGVVAMATNPEPRKRPLIEISFKDLTITLKSKKQHLLRGVTGNIRPSRITAVMGPSGAGKTTFISALAGKTIGCKMTGFIFVNGKNESIHSYRKIIGFVPQDDIVHGNLTVEENLWFNARCRLPADLPMPDKVLVVERVIDSLGLQTVRNSLVGTVEKRGISGGQRKRVNVGLEMVMEPSLLILDEPTSGLDSASSQLLLRALRREALEGVNICMVLHQPSYTLFKMFDDLILLAKGGLTVYHGSAKKAEEYFAGLGINVPERVNPPDYYIDILEGIVTPSERSHFNYKELPYRWMLHNGLQVPSDIQQNAAGLNMHPTGLGMAIGVNPNGPEMEDRSFVEELWQDVKHNVEVHQDKIKHNFLISKDLSSRRTPGLLLQYRYYVARVGKQRMRDAKTQAVDYLILLLAGACLGSLTKMSDENFGAVCYTYTIIAVSLLCKIAALRSFSLEKLQYWRESASGMSSLAYFLARDTIDHFNTVIKPVVYLSMFYFFVNPRSTFTDNYIVLLCMVYCVTGIAYALAIALEPGPAQLWAVLLPVVLTLVGTQRQGNQVVMFLTRLCYPKWALEAFVIANAERYYGVWLITRCGSLMQSGYNLNRWILCILILLLIGLLSRIFAFTFMIIFQRK